MYESMKDIARGRRLIWHKAVTITGEKLSLKILKKSQNTLPNAQIKRASEWWMKTFIYHKDSSKGSWKCFSTKVVEENYSTVHFEKHDQNFSYVTQDWMAHSKSI